jgi:hypothetical protein
LAPQPVQHRLVKLGGGSLTHRTSLPFICSCSRTRRSQLDGSPNFQPTTSRTYDKSMVKPDDTRSVRRLLWLAAGMLFGLMLGFAFGLARPRARK